MSQKSAAGTTEGAADETLATATPHNADAIERTLSIVEQLP
jgi:hypothetical protein